MLLSYPYTRSLQVIAEKHCRMFWSSHAATAYAVPVWNTKKRSGFPFWLYNSAVSSGLTSYKIMPNQNFFCSIFISWIYSLLNVLYIHLFHFAANISIEQKVRNELVFERSAGPGACPHGFGFLLQIWNLIGKDHVTEQMYNSLLRDVKKGAFILGKGKVKAKASILRVDPTRCLAWGNNKTVMLPVQEEKNQQGQSSKQSETHKDSLTQWEKKYFVYRWVKDKPY